MQLQNLRTQLLLILVPIVVLLLAACAGSQPPSTSQPVGADPAHDAAPEILALPDFQPATLDGERLKVFATTSIIGDVLAQVGGDSIELTTLLGPGQDPHSYTPTARDLATASQADIIFVNGWNLEGSLERDLLAVADHAIIVPISAGIQPMSFGDTSGHTEEEDDHGQAHEDGDEHGNIDPHVWFSIASVEQWTLNAQQSFSALDPANAALYATNADAYLAELTKLAAYAQNEIDLIPPARHLLVTNHDSFGYFARDYGFEVLGTVIPGLSTLAEPSASDMAALTQTMREHDVCTLFAETTVSDSLAQTIASELDACDEVQVLKLYTGAIGPVGSGADSYIGMMRANVDTIVEGLR